jgi:tetratricopeptide (TPR) repeat protein
VAQFAVQAAEALEHAHQVGVVHRDIKPANLLVDGRGHLWVTDFGLAQCRSRAALTLSGDLVGTLRYMSPEQALGQRTALDHRTDLYSLGATLYELLTGQPPFGGSDRQELLRQIALEEPAPPRRCAKAIPTELETIVLKLLEKRPADRYATAQEVAADLERFLKDEPIRARRPTPWQRLRKWARRHRPVVWSAAATLLVTLPVLAGSVGWVLRDQAARRARMVADVEAALKEAREYQSQGKWVPAQAAARRAALLLHDAGDASPLAEQVQSLEHALAEDEADARLVVRLDELRLLQSDLDARENRLLLERARPDYRAAFASYGLGETMKPEEAAALLRRRPPAVRGTFLAALDHWLIQARQEKAPETGWLERVVSLADTDPWRQAVRAVRDRNDLPALEKLAREVEVASQPPEALFLLEMSLRQRGAKQAAVALLRRARNAFPGDFWFNHDLGLALRECQPPQTEQAVRFLTVAVALRPKNPVVHLNLGAALTDLGRFDEALAASEQAVALKPDYAEAHWNRGVDLAVLGRVDEALAASRRALTLKPNLPLAVTALRWLAKQHADYAPVHDELGNALRDQGQLREAVAAYRQAIKLKSDYAEAYCHLGCVLQQLGEYAPALAALKRGHELGSQRPGWPYPSARWIRECQRQGERAGQLPPGPRPELPHDE